MSQLESDIIEKKTVAITTKNIEQKEEKSGIPEISIKAEPVFHLNSFKVTNSLVLSAVVLVFSLIIALRYSKEVVSARKSGFFYILTPCSKDCMVCLNPLWDTTLPSFSHFKCFFCFTSYFKIGLGFCLVLGVFLLR